MRSTLDNKAAYSVQRPRERTHRDDRDLLCVFGRKFRRGPWEKFIAGQIDLFCCSSNQCEQPIFLNRLAELSFRMSELAAITRDESLANLFAFVATELQATTSSSARVV